MKILNLNMKLDFTEVSEYSVNLVINANGVTRGKVEPTQPIIPITNELGSDNEQSHKAIFKHALDSVVNDLTLGGCDVISTTNFDEYTKDGFTPREKNILTKVRQVCKSLPKYYKLANEQSDEYVIYNTAYYGHSDKSIKLSLKVNDRVITLYSERTGYKKEYSMDIYNTYEEMLKNVAKDFVYHFFMIAYGDESHEFLNNLFD